MKRILLIVLTLSIVKSFKAQEDLTIYYMENVTQRTYLNPAFSPKAKQHLGIPGISSIHVTHSNSTLTPANLLNDDFTALALNEFKEKIRTNNFIDFKVIDSTKLPKIRSLK